MSYDWKEKVVLVTGASSGIGRALAVELGRRGACVGLTARRAEELMKVAGEVERAGVRALAVAADVRNAEEVRGVRGRVRVWGGGSEFLNGRSGRGTSICSA